MAYLNLDPDFPDHPKTRRLIGLVGGNAEALLVRLWCFVTKYHGDSGRLAGYTSQEIEAIVRWDGAPGVLVGALCTLGWLHKAQNGYQVHDWADHQGHIGALKTRAKKAAKARWDKIGDSGDKDDASSNAQALDKQCPIPNQSLPPQPNQEKEKPPLPPKGQEIAKRPRKADENALPFWQEMIDHMDRSWSAFKKKKTGNDVKYPWPDRSDRRGQGMWGSLRSRAKLYSCPGIMSLWDLYLLLDDNWVRSTGYSIEAFMHKIPVLVDDPRWKSLMSKHQDTLSRPVIQSIGDVLKQINLQKEVA